MRRTRRKRANGGGGLARGAAQLRLLDVLTAVILLAILLWASWKQFPAYQGSSSFAGARPPAPYKESPPTENP
jgi:hypothetical protein